MLLVPRLLYTEFSCYKMNCKRGINFATWVLIKKKMQNLRINIYKEPQNTHNKEQKVYSR